METENTTTELVQVKFELPVIPEVLNINGIEVSNDLLLEQEKIADTLTINGFLDEEGYAAMKDFKNKVLKMRTQSEAYRKKIAKPVTDKLSELKGVTDGFGLICKRIEDKLAPKLEAYENYKEEERKRIAEENKAKAEARAVILVENGMQFNGAGTYRFPEHLDQSVFVLQDELGEMTDDEFEAKLSEVKPVWEAEAERVAKVKADQEKAQLEKDRLIADVNEERTEFRKEQLSDKGFEFDADLNMWFKEGFTAISETDILKTNKDDWKGMITPTKVQVVDFGNYTDAAMPNLDVRVVEPVTEAVSFYEPSTETVTFDTVEEVKFEEAIEPSEAKSEHRNDVVLLFDKEYPFKDSDVKEGFKLRVFPTELQGLCLDSIDESDEGNVAFDTVIGDLRFIVFKA
jgi:copper chaperone CopZ